jgi:uncharacterized membrane protein
MKICFSMHNISFFYCVNNMKTTLIIEMNFVDDRSRLKINSQLVFPKFATKILFLVKEKEERNSRFPDMNISLMFSHCLISILLTNAARSVSRFGWLVIILVLSCVVGAGIAGYIFYRYRLRVSDMPFEELTNSFNFFFSKKQIVSIIVLACIST